jgi:hypothetical protein
MPNSLAYTYINISGEPAASIRDRLANTFFENMMKFKYLSTVTNKNGICNTRKAEWNSQTAVTNKLESLVFLPIIQKH